MKGKAQMTPKKNIIIANQGNALDEPVPESAQLRGESGNLPDTASKAEDQQVLSKSIELDHFDKEDQAKMDEFQDTGAAGKSRASDSKKFGEDIACRAESDDPLPDAQDQDQPMTEEEKEACIRYEKWLGVKTYAHVNNSKKLEEYIVLKSIFDHNLPKLEA